MKIYKSITELIGKTPLLRLYGVEKELLLDAKLIVKLENRNPLGSSKDRVAKYILESMEATGKLKPGTTVIEPTSGNTGIALACIASAMGYKAVIVMPESMSEERKALVRAYGAELVLTEAELGMAGAIAKAEQLRDSTPGSIILGQFVNPDNPTAHIKSTGPEIFEDTEGEVDIFVAGIGTGGTISGVGEYLKSLKATVEVVGVEPDTSAVLSGGKAGAHKLQGIGAGFVPETLNREIVDRVLPVSYDDAKWAARLLAKCDGVLSGISSGASLFAAITEAKKEENKGKTIVAIIHDTGERYLTTDLFE